MDYFVKLLHFAATDDFIFFSAVQKVGHFVTFSIFEGEDRTIFHFDVDCMNMKVHRLPAGPFSNTLSGMMKVSFLYLGIKRYGIWGGWSLKRLPYFVLLLKAVLSSKFDLEISTHDRCALRSSYINLILVFLAISAWLFNWATRLLSCWVNNSRPDYGSEWRNWVPFLSNVIFINFIYKSLPCQFIQAHRNKEREQCMKSMELGQGKL